MKLAVNNFMLVYQIQLSRYVEINLDPTIKSNTAILNVSPIPIDTLLPLILPSNNDNQDLV